VRLEFLGKSGQLNDFPITDHAIAADLKWRANRAGPSGRLFPMAPSHILRSHMKELGGQKFTPKDLRTHRATSLALAATAKHPAPKTEREYKRAVNAVGDEVSQQMCHARGVCLSTYINPAVFAHWRRSAGIEEALSVIERPEAIFGLGEQSLAAVGAEAADGLPREWDAEQGDEPQDAALVASELGFDPR